MGACHFNQSYRARHNMRMRRGSVLVASRFSLAISGPGLEMNWEGMNEKTMDKKHLFKTVCRFKLLWIPCHYHGDDLETTMSKCERQRLL